MSYRNIGFIVFGAISACSLGTGCLQLGIEGNGAAGMGGSAGAAGAAGMGGSAGAGGEMPAAWWDPAWSHRIRITFQNAGGEALSGFPVMIRLDPLRIPDSQASATGADLRFIDDDGQTILPYEIDGWLPGGDSFVWVGVPTIDATDTDHIWLYYGNPAAKDVQNTAAVWNGFIGVYHLSPSASLPTQFADSVSANDGTWFNDQAGVIVPGPINEAIRLDGAQFVHIGENDNVAADPGEARTVEAWIRPAQWQDQMVVHEEGQCVGWYLGTDANSQYRGSFSTDSVAPLCADGISHSSVTTSAPTEPWNYVTLVIDRPGFEMRLFVDGTLAKLVAINNTDIADGNGVFRIGSDHDGGAGTFIGLIDEVRVSSSARSAGWIAAQYKSMTDNFLSFKVE